MYKDLCTVQSKTPQQYVHTINNTAQCNLSFISS